MNNAEYNHYHALQDRMDVKQEKINTRSEEIAKQMLCDPDEIQTALYEMLAGSTALPKLLILNKGDHKTTHDVLWNHIKSEINALAYDAAAEEISWDL